MRELTFEISKQIAENLASRGIELSGNDLIEDGRCESLWFSNLANLDVYTGPGKDDQTIVIVVPRDGVRHLFEIDYEDAGKIPGIITMDEETLKEFEVI